jgi:hypothetical protein
MIHTLRDVLGFTSIVDRTEISDLPWQRTAQPAGKRPARSESSNALPYDTGRFPDEPWQEEVEDEGGYHPSESAAPYGEGAYGAR